MILYAFSHIDVSSWDHQPVCGHRNASTRQCFTYLLTQHVLRAPIHLLMNVCERLSAGISRGNWPPRCVSCFVPRLATGSMLYEQSSKLPNTKICIRWTLVFIKCKKLSLAMGPFQIAIPHVELHECWFRQVLASVIYLGSGLKEKDRERKRKEKEKEKGRKRKRNRKGKGRGNRKERKSKEKGKGKRKKRKRKEKRKDKEREKLKKDTKGKGQKKGKQKERKRTDSAKKNRVGFSDTIAMP